MNWSCELDTSQHVGCMTTAASRGQCCAWRVLLQSHTERSLQETFIVQELFWLKYLHCSYPASTCLQLASYPCSLCRKQTNKCFSISSPHFLCPPYLSPSPEHPYFIFSSTNTPQRLYRHGQSNTAPWISKNVEHTWITWGRNVYLPHPTHSLHFGSQQKGLSPPFLPSQRSTEDFYPLISMTCTCLGIHLCALFVWLISLAVSLT